MLELRSDGRSIGLFVRLEDALDQVRAMMKVNPDCEPELVDARTGQPLGPLAAIDWRGELAKSIG